ncbi:hypothetical protein ASE14_07575 [Agromyces sp. Root81]|uniref:hypothetical protein n=1 Tax=Agromyces sp. Root81 TaxID=1736601 RepID=UPI0006F3E711|nr:hypothetical protein [Agromyces sp. Root81]KRC60822.1 hypothetical protein ASE14_07575 [Agromyces sp. Root81]
MTYGVGLTSPKGVPARVLDGSADEIEKAGRHYIDIGERMSATADELKKLGDDEKYTAESLDKVRESARELHGDLRKVGARYEKSGPVLVTYASALRTARTSTVDPLVEQIIAAHQAHEDALDEERAAKSKVDDYDTTWLWETEATDSQKDVASSNLADARSASSAAESSLDELWTSFDSGFANWESAYDAAVSGMEDAIDASGINDSWWEDALDQIATVATVIGTVAVIAALVIGGPITLAVAAVAGIVALVAHVVMMACGSKRVSWTDIAFDTLSVVPFLGAFAKAVGPGVRSLGLLRGSGSAFRGALGLNNASQGFLAVGRNAIIRDLQTVTGAGRFAGNRGARELAAPGLADAFLAANRGGWATNAWNAIRSGGSIVDGQAFTLSQRLASGWPGAGMLPAGERAATWAAQYSGMPGMVGQGVNVWNAGYGTYQGLQGVEVPLPDMPDFIGDAVDWVKGR